MTTFKKIGYLGLLLMFSIPLSAYATAKALAPLTVNVANETSHTLQFSVSGSAAKFVQITGATKLAPNAVTHLQVTPCISEQGKVVCISNTNANVEVVALKRNNGANNTTSYNSTLGFFYGIKKYPYGFTTTGNINVIIDGQNVKTTSLKKGQVMTLTISEEG